MTIVAMETFVTKLSYLIMMVYFGKNPKHFPR